MAVSKPRFIVGVGNERRSVAIAENLHFITVADGLVNYLEQYYTELAELHPEVIFQLYSDNWVKDFQQLDLHALLQKGVLTVPIDSDPNLNTSPSKNAVLAYLECSSAAASDRNHDSFGRPDKPRHSVLTMTSEFIYKALLGYTANTLEISNENEAKIEAMLLLAEAITRQELPNLRFDRNYMHRALMDTLTYIRTFGYNREIAFEKFAPEMYNTTSDLYRAFHGCRDMQGLFSSLGTKAESIADLADFFLSSHMLQGKTNKDFINFFFSLAEKIAEKKARQS